MTPTQTTADTTAPFGTYALPALRERVRRLGDAFPTGKAGRMGSSAMRRLALRGVARGMAGPHDVEVDDGVKARLYPQGNRCEKRAFAGVHHWDRIERNALRRAIETSERRPFIFLDVGANVGLYSLYAHAYARKAGTPVRIVAIEPDPENRARLSFNTKASDADIHVEAVAISSRSGKGALSATKGNRGGIALTETLEIGGTEVVLEPLAALVERLALPHIDAMKVDIEGQDLAALTAFFSDAPQSLFPTHLQLEVGRGEHAPLIDLAQAHGYELTTRTGLNALLQRTPTDGAQV